MDRLSVLGTPAAAPTDAGLHHALVASSGGGAGCPSAGGPCSGPIRSPSLRLPTLLRPRTGQDGQAGLFTNRPSDQDLTNLSRWLYPLIKYRLKGELREDRERAGLLTDHYRRW